MTFNNEQSNTSTGVAAGAQTDTTNVDSGLIGGLL